MDEYRKKSMEGWVEVVALVVVVVGTSAEEIDVQGLMTLGDDDEGLLWSRRCR